MSWWKTTGNVDPTVCLHKRSGGYVDVNLDRYIRWIHCYDCGTNRRSDLPWPVTVIYDF